MATPGSGSLSPYSFGSGKGDGGGGGDRAAAARATRRRTGSAVGGVVGTGSGPAAGAATSGGLVAMAESAGDGAPTLVDWFMKRGKLKKKLKNRIFMLYADRIEYKKRASGPVRGTIQLGQIMEVRSTQCLGTENDQVRFILSIETKSRTWILASSSSEAVDRWAAQLVAKRQEAWDEFRLLQLQKRYGTWYSLKPSVSPIEHRTVAPAEKAAAQALLREQAALQNDDEDEDEDDSEDDDEDAEDGVGDGAEAKSGESKQQKPRSSTAAGSGSGSRPSSKRYSSKRLSARVGAARAGPPGSAPSMAADTMDRLSTIADTAAENISKLLDQVTALGNTDYELHGASQLLERIQQTMGSLTATTLPQLAYAVTLHKTNLAVLHESAIADWDRQGWLLKGDFKKATVPQWERLRGLHSYSKRFCVVDGSIFRYFKSDVAMAKGKDPRGQIDLRTVTEVRHTQAPKAPKFAFDMVTPTHIFTVVPSPADRAAQMRWITMLRHVIANPSPPYIDDDDEQVIGGGGGGAAAGAAAGRGSKRGGGKRGSFDDDKDDDPDDPDDDALGAAGGGGGGGGVRQRPQSSKPGHSRAASDMAVVRGGGGTGGRGNNSLIRPASAAAMSTSSASASSSSSSASPSSSFARPTGPRRNKGRRAGASPGRTLTATPVAQDCPATGAGAQKAHAAISAALGRGHLVFFTFKGQASRAGGEPFTFEVRAPPEGGLPEGQDMRSAYDAFRANFKVTDPVEKFEAASRTLMQNQKKKYLSSLSLIQALFAGKARVVLMRVQKQPGECVQPFTGGDVMIVWSPLRDSGNVSFEDRTLTSSVVVNRLLDWLKEDRHLMSSHVLTVDADTTEQGQDAALDYMRVYRRLFRAAMIY